MGGVFWWWFEGMEEQRLGLLFWGLGFRSNVSNSGGRPRLVDLGVVVGGGGRRQVSANQRLSKCSHSGLGFLGLLLFFLG